MTIDPAQLDTEITGVTADSRRVRRGNLFAALPGTRDDGRRFIVDAVERGAAAVLAPEGTKVTDLLRKVALITDNNPRKRYATMAARYFARQPETVAAVTGTNGKTSVAVFLRQIWARLGYPAASAGTLGTEVSDAGEDIYLGGSLTTPDPAELHAMLAELKGRGVEHLAIEASSHGLDQYRLDGVAIRAAAFTNLSRDHLDYHGDENRYFNAKRRLFSELLPHDGCAVLNADHPRSDELRQQARERGCRVITTGFDGKEIHLLEQHPSPGGQRLVVELFGQRIGIDLPLVGSFQASNALISLGLAIGCDADPEAASVALSGLRSVRGRLEKVAELENGAAIYVDYAHTPDALSTVLCAIRPHVKGRLAVVFGCGGDRDSGKRPLMGRAAFTHADRVIVTDDNPRTEDPADIRKQTMVGCPDAVEIGDRATAIQAGAQSLGPGDVLVVAGKGHEQGQIVGDRTIPFDDASVVRAALSEVRG
ncbi:MAG: UDP-N-acetylmuramoyl-L-alanyl-D-glutamate--2,6-diaminopimelate ligase [Rhodospirillales bacterium]